MPEHSSRNFLVITLIVLVVIAVMLHHRRPRLRAHRSKLFSSVAYREARPQHHVFGDLAAFVDVFQIDLTAPGDAEELDAGAVAPNFFHKIGVEPFLGRSFRTTEDWQDHVVILGHDFWRRHFHSMASVVGRQIGLDGESYRVIGVLPADFTWNNNETDVWLPCKPEADEETPSSVTQLDWPTADSEI